jgi:DNA-binding transcriptional LysR family regulator
MTVRWLTCAAPAYLKRHGTPRVPQDLKKHNCLYYSFLEASLEWRFHSRRGDVKPGDAKVRVAGNFTANNSEAIREAALKGLGIALLPTFLVMPDLKAARLTQMLADYEIEGAVANDVYALHLPTPYVSPKVRAFVDFFVERFSTGAG